MRPDAASARPPEPPLLQVRFGQQQLAKYPGGRAGGGFEEEEHHYQDDLVLLSRDTPFNLSFSSYFALHLIAVDDPVLLTIAMAQRAVADKVLARAVARGFSTSARVCDQPQAIKPTTDPQTGKPANPNPPPRSAATTQHPGAKAIQQSSPSYSPEPRKPNAPPVPSQYSEVTKKLVFGLARLFGHDTRSSRAIRVTSDLYDRCAEVWDSDAEFWQRGERQNRQKTDE